MALRTASKFIDKLRENRRKLTKIKRAAHAAEEEAKVGGSPGAYCFKCETPLDRNFILVHADKWADLMVACGAWMELKSE